MGKKKQPAKKEIVGAGVGNSGSKKSELALQDSETALTSIFNIVGTGILVIDSETQTILEVNQTAADIVGRTKENMVGQICHSFICPAEAGKCPVKDLGQSIDNSERKIICGDGQWRDILKNVSPFIFKGRECYLESFVDITERKKAEKQIGALANLLSSANVSIIVHDVDGDFIYVNQATLDLHGYSREEFMSLNLHELNEPESAKLVTPRVQHILKTGETSFEVKHYRKDRSTIPLLVNVCTAEWDGEKAILSILFDITERKQAEEALQKSQDTYRLLADNISDIVWMMDLDLKVTWVSPSAVKARGYTLDELLALPLDRQITPESLGKAVHLIGKWTHIEKEGRTPDPHGAISTELEFICKDGHTFVAECSFQFIRDEQGKATSILAEGRDITERKQAQVELRESEGKYRALVETTNTGFLILDMQGKVIDANQEYVRLTGYHELSDIVGKNVIDWTADYEKKKNAMAVNQCVKAGFIRDLVIDYVDRNGRITPVEINATVNGSGESLCIISLCRDITMRKKAEKAVHESEEKYRSVVENAQEAIFIAVDGMIKFANSRATVLSGYSMEEFMSKPFIEFVHPDDRQMMAERYLQHLDGKDVPPTDFIRLIFKQGDIRWTELTIGHIAWEGRPATLGFLTDITDRKRMEGEQLRVAKLESVGLLAGGIAHDFNNILTAILGNISLASVEATPGSKLQESLEQAEKASQRARALTQQLLTFSKGGAPVLKLASLTELLKDTAGFALSGSKVKCNFSIPSDLWHAEIDAGQVSQIIHNLVINAQQAMPAGGTIELRAENIALSETQKLGKGLPLKAGKYIRITVADNGSGISKDHLEKIFDPFFTTKKTGTGLGLATSFSIARQHGGHLSVESVIGSGSTFYLYLPASLQKSTPEQDKHEQIKPVGKARILVMDDEQGVREIAGRMLKHIGYKDIGFAKDGAEAIKLYKAALKSGNPFSVVILDLTIPGGLGGKEVVRKLLKIDPGVKAIVSSGYIDDSVIAKYREYGFSGIVAKPYSIEQLRKAVQDVIG